MPTNQEKIEELNKILTEQYGKDRFHTLIDEGLTAMTESMQTVGESVEKFSPLYVDFNDKLTHYVHVGEKRFYSGAQSLPASTLPAGGGGTQTTHEMLAEIRQTCNRMATNLEALREQITNLQGKK